MLIDRLTRERDRIELVRLDAVAQQMRHATGGGQRAERRRRHDLVHGARARAQHDAEVLLRRDRLRAHRQDQRADLLVERVEVVVLLQMSEGK